MTPGGRCARAGLCEKAATNDRLIEELCKIINGAFSKEIEVVEKHGGEVLCFLGDGLLVFWPDLAPPGSDAPASEGAEGKGRGAPALGSPPTSSRAVPPGPRPGSPEAPGEAGAARMAARVAAAVLCALEIQEVFSEACVGMGSDMRLRVAVAAGEFAEYFCGIGGATSGGGGAGAGAGPAAPAESALVYNAGRPVPGRMVHFIAGPAIAEAGEALAAVKAGRWRGSASAGLSVPGAVPEREGWGSPAAPEGPAAALLSAPVAQPLSRVARRGSGGGARGGAPLRPPPPRALGPPPPPAATRPPDPAELGPDGQDAVALYVPYTVRARFEDMREWAALSGVRDFDPTRFLSEFRVVSVLFMKLEGLDPSHASVQRTVSTLQATLYSYEGSLRQIVFDDKGVVFIAVFGLWPFAHEDDPARAVACAADMQASMRAMGVRAHVGITTGLVFCTFVGSSSRSEFSVFGTVVNRAARLMALAEGGILVDGKTSDACQGQIGMELVGAFKLKGIDEKMPVYRPLLRRGSGACSPSERPGADDPAADSSSSGAFVARAAETARIEALLAAAASAPAAPARLFPRGGAAAGGGAEQAAGAEGAGEPEEPSPPAFVLYEGPSGSGKSTLCAYAARVAAGLGMTTVAGAGRSNRARQPWFLWRAVLRQLFPLGALDMGPLLDEEDFELLGPLAQALQLDAAAGPAGASEALPLASHFASRHPHSVRVQRSPPISPAPLDPEERAPAPLPDSAAAPKRRVGVRKSSITWVTAEALMGEEHAPPSPHAGAPAGRSASAPSAELSDEERDAKGGAGGGGGGPEAASVAVGPPVRFPAVPRALRGRAPPPRAPAPASAPKRARAAIEPSNRGPRQRGGFYAWVEAEAPAGGSGPPPRPAPRSARRRRRGVAAGRAGSSSPKLPRRRQLEAASVSFGSRGVSKGRAGGRRSVPLAGLAGARHAPPPRRPDSAASERDRDPSGAPATSPAGTPCRPAPPPRPARAVPAPRAPRPRAERGGSRRGGGAGELNGEYLTSGIRGLVAKLVTRRAAAGRPSSSSSKHADSQSWAVVGASWRPSPGPRGARPPRGRRHAPAAAAGEAAVGLSRRLREAGPAAVQRVELGPLSEGDLEALVLAAIGAQRLPRALQAFIAAQTEGLPILVEDLARSLVKDGTLEVDAYGEVIVKKALRRLKPTDGARSALVGSLDRLTPSQAMTLKLASVAGVRFSATEIVACRAGTGLGPAFGAAAEAGPGASESSRSWGRRSSAPLASSERESEARRRPSSARVEPGVRAGPFFSCASLLFAAQGGVGAGAGPGAVAEAVARDLAALVRLRMLAEAGAGEGGPDRVLGAGEEAGGTLGPDLHLEREYEFEVVYTLLPPAERRALHRELALHHEERLAARGGGVPARAPHRPRSAPPRTRPSRAGGARRPASKEHDDREADLDLVTVLAHHYQLAGDEERACVYVERCARVAHKQYANLEAVRLYEDLLGMGGARAPRLALVRWLRCHGEALARMDLNVEACGSFLRALEALGLPAPRSSLLRSAATALNALRALARRPPPLHDYLRRAAARPLSPDELAEQHEATLVMSGATMAAYSCSQMNLNKYLISKAAWLGASRVEVGPMAAMCLARLAQFSVFAGRRDAAVQWAELAWAVAREVDSRDVWASIAIPVSHALLVSLEHASAGSVTAFFADSAFFHKDVFLLAVMNALRATLGMRGDIRTAFSAGFASLRADIQVVLESASRQPDLVSDFFVMVNQGVLALFEAMGRPAAALDALEAFLASRASNANVHIRTQVLAAGAHAEALWRARGTRGRARDGRCLARVAVEGCEFAWQARLSDIPGRLAEFADAAWGSLFAAYLCTLQRDADRAAAEGAGEAPRRGRPGAAAAGRRAGAPSGDPAGARRNPAGAVAAEGLAGSLDLQADGSGGAPAAPTDAELQAAVLKGSRFFAGPWSAAPLPRLRRRLPR
eukprot:tig00000754_g3887.t1